MAKTSEAKTKKTEASVDDFIAGVEPARQADCNTIIALMEKLTKSPPKMWGGTIVGFDTYTYKYESGREGEWPRVGFSPRKQNLTLYIMSGFDEYDAIMTKLGKCKTGKSCLYINSLADIDMKALEKLVKASLKYMKEKYPT